MSDKKQYKNAGSKYKQLKDYFENIYGSKPDLELESEGSEPESYSYWDSVSSEEEGRAYKRTKTSYSDSNKDNKNVLPIIAQFRLFSFNNVFAIMWSFLFTITISFSFAIFILPLFLPEYNLLYYIPEFIITYLMDLNISYVFYTIIIKLW